MKLLRLSRLQTFLLGYVGVCGAEFGEFWGLIFNENPSRALLTETIAQKSPKTSTKSTLTLVFFLKNQMFHICFVLANQSVHIKIRKIPPKNRFDFM